MPWIEFEPRNPAEYQDKREAYLAIYDAIWRNMDRECNLINARITWAILLSGGLLATEGIIVQRVQDAAHVTYWISGAFLVLMFFLSVLGCFFSFKTREGVTAAQNQIDYLKNDQYFRFKNLDGENLFEGTYK